MFGKLDNRYSYMFVAFKMRLVQMLKYSAKLLNAVSQSNIKYQSFNHETDLNHELSDDEQKQWI